MSNRRPKTPKVTKDEALALDLERVARQITGLRDRATGITAARLDELRDAALDVASEIGPDVVRRPR